MALELGGWMVSERLLDEGQLGLARDLVARKGHDLVRIVVDMGFVEEQALAVALSRALGLPKVDLAKLAPDAQALAKIPRGLAVRLCAFPCALRDFGGTLWVALANPVDAAALPALERAAGCRVKPTVAGVREIEAAIERHFAWDEADSELLAIEFGEGAAPMTVTDLTGEVVFTAAPPPAIETPAAFAPEELRLLALLEEGVGKSGAALRVVLELCVEKGLLTNQALEDRLAKAP